MKKFDISKPGSQPGDGDLCKVDSFDAKNAVTISQRAIFDAHRGTFFKVPGKNAGHRSMYKAVRVRNVLEFEVIEKGKDPTPESLGIIDHRATAKAAEEDGATTTRLKPAKGKGKATAGDED